MRNELVIKKVVPDSFEKQKRITMPQSERRISVVPMAGIKEKRKKN